jgi:hypothetical protein
LTPGVSYTIITKLPGSETVEEGASLTLAIQTQPDAVNVRYDFYNGITGTVIGPSKVEIGTKATVRIIAPDGYRLTEIFDSMPDGISLTAIGNDTFTFIAGKNDVWLYIVFTADKPTSSSTVTSIAPSSSASTVTSKPSSVASSAVQTSSQTTSQTSNTGSDTDAPNMGSSGVSMNTAGLVIALFGTLGIALVLIEKRRIRG